MERLRILAADYGIVLSDNMLVQFGLYQQLLLEWNDRMNLTAITDPDEICIKHFLDSILLLKAVELPIEASVIDVGTGAGFPGIPLKIVRPDIQLTLLDSLNKRVQFLQAVSDRLEQVNACVHGRAEEMARDRKFREGFDLATARAVAGLPVLCEYCLPLVKVGGIFAALKGYEIEAELEGAKGAVAILGGALDSVRKFELPMENRRSMVVVKKIAQTATKYPRISAKIAKSPL